MKNVFVFIIFLCAMTRGYSDERETSLLQLDGYPFHKIEIFIQRPAKSPFPLLVFLHGASSDKGLRSISETFIQHWIEKGYGVAAISLPGYGATTGPKDFCGHLTLQALHFALDAIKKEVGVADFGIIGFGQGSLAGLLLTSQRQDIRCIVSANGVYDLLRHLYPEDPLVEVLIAKNYAITINEESFKIRSPIEQISYIHAPVYLLHREDNPVIPEEEVLLFREKMRAAGKKVALSIKEKTEGADLQKLTYEEILEETECWIDAHMYSYAPLILSTSELI